MARLDNVRRINAAEFPKDDRETVERLSVILNFFMEDVVNALNGNIDFENLNREIKELDITVDANGTPIRNQQFTSTVDLAGTKIIRVDNLTNAAVFPTDTPFLTYTTNGTGTFTIQNITGLPANNRFRLIVELVGK